METVDDIIRWFTRSFWTVVLALGFAMALIYVLKSVIDRWRYRHPAAPRLREARFHITDLAQRLSLDAEYLHAFAPGYRPVKIRKRRNGWRTLQVPDEPTKRLQRRVLRRLLGKLHAHSAALGFERGKSIADHAALHSGRAVIVKCDIVDFFGSTTGPRVRQFFLRIGWDEECAALLTKICCHEGALPQGAPTSPRLSNLVNIGLDRILADFAEQRQLRYSRYADDMCFSYEEERRATPRRLRGLLQKVRGVTRTYGYRLHGKDKTRIVRRHRRQLVCGLVVNEKVNLPRETRRRLRAVEHHLATDRPAAMTPDQLQGWKAYASMVAAASSGAADG